MHFPVTRGVLRRGSARQGRRRRRFEIARGRDAGARRRVRLRQVDDRPRDPAALSSRPRASIESRAATSPGSSGGALRALRPRMQMIFQDPYASLNPRMTVGAIIAEPLDDHARLDRRERRKRVQELLDAVGLNRALRQPLPARVLRRPAPAHRHRPGAGLEPEVHRLRRADLRARRLHPGAGRQPAGGPAGEAGADLSLHRPRPLRWCAISRPGGGDVSRPDRRDRARRTRSTQRRCIPTPRRCSRPCRSRPGGRGAAASASS